MMWRGSRRIGAVVWLLCLLLGSSCLVLWSEETSSQASSVPQLVSQVSSASSAQDTAEVEFLQAVQEIFQMHPDTKPQLAQMRNALRKMSESSKNRTANLQTIIDKQAKDLQENAKTISDLKTSQMASTASSAAVETDLQKSAADDKTSATIGWTVAGFGWLAAIIEGILHGFKIW